jgi:lantibiotic transport system permease protein
MKAYLYSFGSEWLKKKRTAASFLTIAGSMLIPLLIIIARTDSASGLAIANRKPQIWENLYDRNWLLMGSLLLQMGIVLAASLVTQLEYRNNTWKQLFTTPQTLTTIFLAKGSVLLVMLIEFFLLFNLGIWLTGTLPGLLLGVPYPPEAFPWKTFWSTNARFFLDSLPILALQYGISLRIKNFLVPLGVGLGMYVASMIAVHWKYGYTIPYTYCTYEFAGQAAAIHHTHLWAAGYAAGFIGLAYLFYITRKEKA